MKWQAIETAPHGQKVLLFGYPFGFKNIWIGQRRDGEHGHEPATHWHPLPEPPK